jgi:hypothetical protein
VPHCRLRRPIKEHHPRKQRLHAFVVQLVVDEGGDGAGRGRDAAAKGGLHAWKLGVPIGHH